MSRKGRQKVRTGCITCKARRVKCDETKPACKRCSSTGRNCDGYKRNPCRQESVILHQPNRAFPGVGHVAEIRALQYFYEVAGPVLSGAVDPYFWTHVVMQFSNFEPAVRHAVIAISSLYEQAQGTFEVGTAVRYTYDNQYLALHHYNAAIHELRTASTEDKQPVVLLVCVLFICIEIMRCNRKWALQHSRHGVKILKNICREYRSTWIVEHLLPIFRRLSEFALFFGDEAADFPDIRELEGPMPQFFMPVSDAQLMLDVLFNRTAELISSHRKAQRERRANASGQETQEVTSILLEHITEQAIINGLLDHWLKLFISFTSILHKDLNAQNHFGSDDRSKLLRCFLLTRFECCRIWLNVAFDISETGYDRFLSTFRRILKQLLWLEAEVPEASRLSTLRHPHFIFEAGFGAMLFFLVSACRHLETRLEFLRLMPILGLPRENMWESDVLIAAGKKIIEVEHDVKLDGSGRPISSPSHIRPPNESRVTDLWKDSRAREENLLMDDEGISCRTIKLLRRDDTGRTYLHAEYLVVNGRIAG
ncbi:C6 zinc finger domain protein [Colletotrichum tofieldiae]|uniref:C6 zinc finger domain protein n=1 Tax=Colletotrichum tofieldiae TaxID=708197 RepID=A0A166NXR9_9PEZI|nr:C6 zinc finger domain protein [Colletotrichum tofieldiae]